MKKDGTSSELVLEAVVEELIHPTHPLVASQITWKSWKPKWEIDILQ